MDIYLGGKVKHSKVSNARCTRSPEKEALAFGLSNLHTECGRSPVEKKK